MILDIKYFFLFELKYTEDWNINDKFRQDEEFWCQSWSSVDNCGLVLRVQLNTVEHSQQDEPGSLTFVLVGII